MSQQFAAITSVPAIAVPPTSHGAAAVRVLHVINGEHYAGAERVQDLLGQRLADFGYRTGFACLKRGQFAAMHQFADAPFYDMAMQNRFDLWPVWRLARIVRDEGYRLIHSHTARSALIGRLASLATGVPLVHHIHSPTPLDTTNRVRNWINCRTERMVLPYAKALIAVSEAVGDYVRQQGFGVFVVPNGVPARARCRPAVQPRSIGRLARWLFRPRKGLEVLLEALAKLRDLGLPVRLRAVGSFESPEYETRIRQLATHYHLDSAIDWVGFARDIDRELACMDIFVLPSLFGEGLPMVVLEAMSAGLPVVASAVPGVPEAVRDGREGLLVEPANAAAMSAAIARMVSGPSPAPSWARGP